MAPSTADCLTPSPTDGRRYRIKTPQFRDYAQCTTRAATLQGADRPLASGLAHPFFMAPYPGHGPKYRRGLRDECAHAYPNPFRAFLAKRTHSTHTQRITAQLFGPF